MKYPCSLIRDLLPLYCDGVCSEESKKIIEGHLAECSACKEYCDSLRGADALFLPQNTDLEMQKAASFRAVKKRIRKRQILIVLLAFVLLAALLFSAVGFLKNARRVIACENAVSVSMVDDSLIARLQGDRADYLRVKQVVTTQNGKTSTFLFFSLSGTAWDALVTSSDVFSEYVLCPADKGAQQIDQVFYYTGDDAGLESMTAEELQKIIDSSVLLWSRK